LKLKLLRIRDVGMCGKRGMARVMRMVSLSALAVLWNLLSESVRRHNYIISIRKGTI